MSRERIRRRGRWALLVAGSLATLFVAGSYLAPVLGGFEGWALSRIYTPLCHQAAERSIAVGGGFQAVCARCAGLYLGGAAGLWIAAAFLGVVTRRLRPWMLAWVCAPTLIDVLLPWLGLPGLSNVPRLWLALPAGLVAGLFLAIGLADLFSGGATPRPIPAAARRTTLEALDG